MHTPQTMKALASPLRRDILSHLANHGPATSTTLAKAMGQNTGTTSYHLRLLADAGFITELPDRAKGRERWWDLIRADRRTPPRDTLTPLEQHLADSRLAEDLQLLTAYNQKHDEDSDWLQGSRSRTFMTKAQLKQFLDEYLALVHRHTTDRDNTPPDARMILLRWVAFPDPRAHPPTQQGTS
jgi:DNA-binding transcriptional ArsR family regulator